CGRAPPPNRVRAGGAGGVPSRSWRDSPRRARARSRAGRRKDRASLTPGRTGRPGMAGTAGWRMPDYNAGVPRWAGPLARAYAACEKLAQSHYENFPVASRLLPPAMRPHVAAVYAFARVADDIADEGNAPAPERLSRLLEWQDRLHEAAAGRVA